MICPRVFKAGGFEKMSSGILRSGTLHHCIHSCIRLKQSQIVDKVARATQASVYTMTDANRKNDRGKS